MGTFDPSTFLDATITGANSTKLTPIPPGEYTAIIEGPLEIKEWKSKDGAKSGYKLEGKYAIDSDVVRQALGRDKVTVRMEAMLDFTDSGALDMGTGKNVSIGRIREATGLNDPTQPFSFRHLEGKMVKIRVASRLDGENVYDEVKAVTKLS